MSHVQLSHILFLFDRHGRVVGFTRLVEEDYERLRHWTWRRGARNYAVRDETRHGKKRRIFLHREVNNTPTGYITDHIDGDTLNNMRDNLRTATSSQNNANAKDRQRMSRYRGVYWHNKAGKWYAQISINGRRCHLGLFDDQAEAAKAYAEAAQQAFGEFARPDVT